MWWQVIYIGSVYIALYIFLYFLEKRRRFKSFINAGIKGPKPHFVLGNLSELRSKSIHHLLDEWIDKYGDFFVYHTSSQSILVSTNLDLLRKVFISDKNFFARPPTLFNLKPLSKSILLNPTWQPARQLMSSYFTRAKIRSEPLATLIGESVDRYLQELNPSKSQQAFQEEIQEKVHCFTYEVILKFFLGIQVDLYHQDNHLLRTVDEFYKYQSKNIFKNVVDGADVLPFIRPIFSLSSLFSLGQFLDYVVAHLKKYTKNVVESQVNSPILVGMIEAYKKGKISEDEIFGNILLLTLGSFHTVSSCIVNTMYLLAKNVSIQNKLREHVQKAGYDHPYMEMVINESLRIYPSVINLNQRRALEDTIINGITIKKGTIITAPVWHIHHSPKYWPDPYKFDPERFDPDNKPKIHPMAFLAFGAGSRACLGTKLGLDESARLLAALVSKYRLKCSSETVDSLQFTSHDRSLLFPIDPINLVFEPIF